jgi:uncharacterized membrane protein
MTNHSAIAFNRGAVEPIDCLKAGWALVKKQYWLFVGMAFIGIFIASVVPLGILLGPMMCGLYLAFFGSMRNQPIEFGTLFKGFDYFGPSLIATLIHMVPIFVIIVPVYIGFYAGMFLMIPQSGGEPDPTFMLSFLGIFGVIWLGIFVLIMVISILFTFSYPLIVDRGLSGVEAVKLSAKAALANFWRLLGLFLINGVLGLIGMLLCYVGVFFLMPISLGALAFAYKQVFGLGEPISNLPPAPPTF